MSRMDRARGEADRLRKAIHTPSDQRTPAQHELVNLAAEETLLVRLMRLQQDQFPVTTDPVPRIVESAQRLVDILVMEAKYKAGDRIGALLDLQEDVTAYRFLAEQKASPN
ncbi:hypothetical protein [Methylobacterium sp. GC_Met_2]|uniref:hypothetical protein n=1 Tax=Methylobacterium sp. GC_Met_2 TaxID=2937376 RepID=UPI00226B9BD1|nr:hypothetical protein [Methylobacterium sp. GC_Met_2]